MRVAAKHLRLGMVITGLPVNLPVTVVDHESVSATLPCRVVVTDVQLRSRRMWTHMFIAVETPMFTPFDDAEFSEFWEAPNGALFDVEVAA